MLYQQPLKDFFAYTATVERIETFPLHRHYELEFLYCLAGTLDFFADGTPYTLRAGEIAVIGSFVPHEYRCASQNEVLVAEIGPKLLKNAFSDAVHAIPGVRLWRQNSEGYAPLHAELAGIVRIRRSPGSSGELELIGCLYKAAAAAIREPGAPSAPPQAARSGAFYGVEDALTAIHTRLGQHLSVKEAAEKAAMSPANFCAAFKKYTGMSFHAYLNAYRVQTAKSMLVQTHLSVQEICAASGFADIKTFYRVFKAAVGCPPGAYREKMTNGG